VRRSPDRIGLGVTGSATLNPKASQTTKGDPAMVDDEDIDQLAAEAVQAIRRYVAAEIARQLGRLSEEEGKE
jgi:hypothetical protein